MTQKPFKLGQRVRIKSREAYEKANEDHCCVIDGGIANWDSIQVIEEVYEVGISWYGNDYEGLDQTYCLVDGNNWHHDSLVPIGAEIKPKLSKLLKESYG